MRGDAGDNVLVAHEGFTTLAGHKGSDTYVVDADAGDVVIRGEGGKSGGDTDILDLSGLASSDVTLAHVGRDLVITINETGNTITVRNHFAGHDDSRGLEVIHLADITLDEAGIADVAEHGWPQVEQPSAQPPTVFGTDAADDLQGTGAGEYVFGLGGDDSIHGNGGDDIIDGGDGLDTIWGGDGADRFVFAEGSGRDYIIDFNPGEDTILIGSSLLGDGKTAMDYAYQDGASVIFEFGDQVLVLWGKDIADIDDTMFEVFNDQGGTEGMTVTGTDGDDILFGGYGDDVIFGGAGLTRYTAATAPTPSCLQRAPDRDFIVDFNAAHDTISIDPSLIEDGKTVWDYAYEDGGSTIFEFASGDSIVLWHVALDDLNPGVFDTCSHSPFGHGHAGPRRPRGVFFHQPAPRGLFPARQPFRRKAWQPRGCAAAARVAVMRSFPEVSTARGHGPKAPLSANVTAASRAGAFTRRDLHVCTVR
ncbi:MAG: hypothetical protein H6891_04750 [Brucellaceae bacterium]|nr:hypothetical protein [Brucellaceae bacterium]